MADAGEASAEIADTLRECIQVLDALNSSFDAEHAGRHHDDYVTWTIEDESYAPGGRELDLRLYYDWEDYSPGDHVTPHSGGYGSLEDIEVVAVRHFWAAVCLPAWRDR